MDTLDRSFLSQPFIISRQQFKNNFLLENCIDLKAAYIYYGFDTDLKFFEYDNQRIYVIGYILDIRDSALSQEEIFKKLLVNFGKSSTEFYDELQYMNGRYTIIIDNDENTYVYTDATGMRPLYYWNNEIISSHEILLREGLNDARGLELSVRPFKMKNFLDYTNTKDIYKFSPNMYFDFGESSFMRFYPNGKFKNQTMETVIKNTEDYFLTQVQWLNNNYEVIYQSITGGFDAKLSLALTKPILEKIKFSFICIDLIKERNIKS